MHARSCIDVGQMYGSDDAKAHLLRNLSTDKGLLRVNEQFTDNGCKLLPFTSIGANMFATEGRITNDSNTQEVVFWPVSLQGFQQISIK